MDFLDTTQYAFNEEVIQAVSVPDDNTLHVPSSQGALNIERKF
jgi:hypothetical protein